MIRKALFTAQLIQKVWISYKLGFRLKCADIEHSKKRIYVSPSKNGKDRYTLLAEESYEILCKYWLSLPAQKRSRDWLFTQQNDLSKPIYPQFIQGFIKQQELLLGWEHRLTAHSFRHSWNQKLLYHPHIHYGKQVLISSLEAKAV